MDRRRLADVAAGRRPAELVLKNALVVHVFTGEMTLCDVAIEGGYIAGLGSYQGLEEHDCTGKIVCPGFIDAHMHMESVMASPFELARAIVPAGTTTVIADPHEIVNVCGTAAVDYLLEATEELPLNVYLMLPSSVPATPFETNGAAFGAAEMEPYLSHPRVLGLGEVMNYPAAIGGDPEVVEKIALARRFGRLADGHAPGITGRDLQAYASLGIATEHECTTFDEAAEKLRAGLAVLVREGSAAKNTAAILGGWLKSGYPDDRLLLCTDDKHIDDVSETGNVRHNVHLAIQMGVDPVTAIRMATINAARVYGLRELGAVAPGYRADLVVLDRLEDVSVRTVYKDGVELSRAFGGLAPVPVPAVLTDSVRCRPLTEGDVALPVEGKTHCIQLVPHQIVTRHLVEEVPCREGFFAPDAVYTKLCVVERHGRNGNLAVCPLKGYGITGGAIATTVAHDSHNIIAAGDNDRDIVTAVNHLREMGGGYVLAAGGKILGQVPLPIAGLMSDAPWERVRDETAAILRKAYGMGIPSHVDPFTTLSFLALPVIPQLRLPDRGLFDVDHFCRL